MAINFYSTNDEFGEFSNFALFPITLKGVIWPTTEHYFQAQKFAGAPHEEAIRLAPSPSQAAKMGRQRSRPLRKDWEQVKDDIMRQAVLAKFQQHPSLQSLLLSTGNADIVEHTKNDAYWGDAGDGSGLNMLGRILMEIRDKLRAASATTQNPTRTIRQVSYLRHEFRHPPRKKKNPLLVFVYDVPHLGTCGIFPPFRLLNEILRSGGSDGGMSPGAAWLPFELTQAEYDDLIAALRNTPVSQLRRNARYARIQFRFDPSFDHLSDFKTWVEAVAQNHRARWHAEMHAGGFLK